MIRRFAVARRVFVFAVVASLPGLAACSRGKEPRDSTHAAAGQAPGAGQSAGAAAPTPQPLGRAAAPDPAQLPGMLPKPLASYSADEFFAFTHALGYGGGIDKPRRCKAATGCEVRGGKLTSARVDAVNGQDALSASVVPQNGVVAVRARNTGAYEEARYGMLPGAAYEYYVVVLPDTGGKARWSLQQLVTTAGARTLTEVGRGTFIACAHASKGSYRANFHTCEDAHRSSDSTMRMGLLLQEVASDPIWVKCNTGCCEVQ